MGLITDLNLPDDFPGTCWVSGAFLFPNSGTLITILKTSPSVRSDSAPPYARLTFIILRRPEPNSSVRPISPINRAITGSFGNGGSFQGPDGQSRGSGCCFRCGPGVLDDQPGGEGVLFDETASFSCCLDISPSITASNLTSGSQAGLPSHGHSAVSCPRSVRRCYRNPAQKTLTSQASSQHYFLGFCCAS